MVGRLRVRGGWGHIAVFICSTRMRRAIVCASMCCVVCNKYSQLSIDGGEADAAVWHMLRLVTMCQLHPFLRDLLPFPALLPAQIRMLHKRRRIRRRSAHRFATVHLASHSLGHHSHNGAPVPFLPEILLSSTCDMEAFTFSAVSGASAPLNPRVHRSW